MIASMTFSVVSEPPAARTTPAVCGVTVADAPVVVEIRLAARVASAPPTRRLRLNKGLFTVFGSFRGNGVSFETTFRVGHPAHDVIIDMQK
jgi:hypothetical protein